MNQVNVESLSMTLFECLSYDDNMLLTLDNEITIDNKNQDDSQAIFDIIRLIKFYLYRKWENKEFAASNLCVPMFEINWICDLYFPQGLGSNVEDKDIFKKELENFVLDLRRSEQESATFDYQVIADSVT